MAVDEKPRPGAGPAIVAATALVLQAAYLLEQSHDPALYVPIIDAGVYHDAAFRFSEGRRLIDDAFWQPPLFPLLLGCLYRVSGPEVLLAKCFLGLLATASCLMTWGIGCRLFSPRVGLVSGLMLAAYGPFLLFSTRLVPVGLAVFLDLLAISIWLAWLEHRRWPWLPALGIVTGAATITVPSSVVLVVVVLLALRPPRAQDQAWRSALAGLLLFVGGLAVPVGAVAVRNRIVSGTWVAISTNGGINFYIGNNADSERTIAVRPGEPWQRLARESFRDGARTSGEQSRHFYRAGLRFLVEQPYDFVGNLARKAMRLVNAREIPRNVDPYTFRESSSLLSLLLFRFGSFGFPFGAISPLAAIGVIVALRENAGSGWRRTGRVGLLVFSAAYGASVVVFFVSGRYRLPMAVAMLPFAAAGLCWMARRVSSRRPGNGSARTGIAAAIAGSVIAVLVNLPIKAPTDVINFRAETAMCVGDAFFTRGDSQRARHHLREALSLHPRYTDAATRLAAILANAGEMDQALELIQNAASWDPRSVHARVLMGKLCDDVGLVTRASAAFHDAVEVDPTSPAAHTALADHLGRTGQDEKAVTQYRAALELTQDTGSILIGLADALVRLQRYEEAIERYRQALWRLEPDAATLSRIAWLLATCPQAELRDCAQAVDLASQACAITESLHAGSLGALAAAHAECGNWSQAVRRAERTIEVARAEGDVGLAESSQRRLELYRRHLTSEDRPE